MALGSIVDYLNAQKKDSSFSARKDMAEKFGIQNYKGTAQQNTQLLGMLQKGSSGPNGSGTVGAAPQAPAAVTAGQPGTAPGTTMQGTASGSTTQQRNYKPSKSVQDMFDRMQSAADNMPGGYSMSDHVEGYRDKLDELEANKPGSFKSKFTDQINQLLDQILNQKDFSYTGKDLMNDDLYKMYSDMFEQNARKAMQNAMGDAATMTGGYGSTFSQAAGQQAYDGKMSKMNEIVMFLADRAYERYLNDRTDRYKQMGVLTDLDDTDYVRHRDTVGDWKDELAYYANRYDSEYAKDYGQYRDEVSDAQNERDYWAGIYDMVHDNDFNEYGSDLEERQWQQEFKHQQEMDAAELAIRQAEEARAAEAWALEKQKMQLAAMGGGGSGRRSSSGSSRKKSGYGKSGKSTSNNGGLSLTAADVEHAKAHGATPEEIRILTGQITTNPVANMEAGGGLRTGVELAAIRKKYLDDLKKK